MDLINPQRKHRGVQYPRRVEDQSGMTSSIRLACQHNISHSTIWRILKMQQLYPYHVQKVQSGDLPRR
jgi:hypothetical protein